VARKKSFPCWRNRECKEKECPAYGEKEAVCWLIPDSRCFSGEDLCLKEKFLKHCTICPTYRGAAKRAAPGAVIRLALYLEEAERLMGRGETRVSSHRLGGAIRVNPAQVRKDLGQFRIPGAPKRGYELSDLVRNLRTVLGLVERIPAVLVGCDACASMLAASEVFAPGGTFELKRVFSPRAKVESRSIAGRKVFSRKGLPAYVERERIRVAVVADHDPETERVLTWLADSPVRAILNFSPFRADMPPGKILFSFDLKRRLSVLAYYLQHPEIPLLPEYSMI